MAITRAAVLEPRAAERRRISQGLRQAGLTVTEATEAEALRREGLVVLGPSLEAPGRLVRQVRQQAPRALVLAARTRLQKVAGVDGLLPLPVSPLDLAVRLPELARLRQQATRQKADRQAEGSPRGATGEGILDPLTHFYTFPHFREVLYIEVKRARRYGFPFSLALVGFDPLEVKVTARLRSQLNGGLALAIRRSLRDTDLPVQYAPDRVLLVMPHTDLQGALVVSRRICERVGRASLTVDGRVLTPTISVGVAGAPVGAERSFSDLVRQAQEGLEAAQAAGGNRVEMGEPPPPEGSAAAEG